MFWPAVKSKSIIEDIVEDVFEEVVVKVVEVVKHDT